MKLKKIKLEKNIAKVLQISTYKSLNKFPICRLIQA